MYLSIEHLSCPTTLSQESALGRRNAAASVIVIMIGIFVSVIYMSTTVM